MLYEAYKFETEMDERASKIDTKLVKLERLFMPYGLNRGQNSGRRAWSTFQCFDRLEKFTLIYILFLLLLTN